LRATENKSASKARDLGGIIQESMAALFRYTRAASPESAPNKTGTSRPELNRGDAQKIDHCACPHDVHAGRSDWKTRAAQTL
jgi:hypothetical protein